MTVLVIASGNAGKVREFAHLLAGLPITVRPQPEGLEVEESGTTFGSRPRPWPAPPAAGPWPTTRA